MYLGSEVKKPMLKVGLLNPYANIQNVKLSAYLQGFDNIGNAVYLNLLCQKIPDCQPIITCDLILNPGKYKQSIDLLVLPFSNMISKYWAATELIDTLIEYKFNILLLSVGIQAENSENMDKFSISSDSLRLLQYANSCGLKVGARGHITSHVLEANRISHSVIGCPTALSNVARELKPGTLEKIDPEKSIIALNITPTGHVRENVIDLYMLFCKTCSIYFHQSEHRIIFDIHNFEINTIFSDLAVESGEYSNEIAKVYSNPKFDYTYYCPEGINAIELENAFRMRSFFSLRVSEWMNSLRRCHLSFGGRFHGNMLALHSGVPALFLDQDKRTRELIEFHCLPSLSYVPNNVKDIAASIDYGKHCEALSAKQSDFLQFLSHSSISNYDFSALCY